MNDAGYPKYCTVCGCLLNEVDGDKTAKYDYYCPSCGKKVDSYVFFVTNKEADHDRR